MKKVTHIINFQFFICSILAIMVLSALQVDAQTTVSSAISVGADDAEENLVSSSVSLGSTDLEMGEDAGQGFAQLAGLRFRGFSIPQGASITNAYIEFQVDEVGNNSGSTDFYGEDVDSPADFSTATNNISSRTKTTATVSWSPTSWVVGTTEATPDLSSIIQEIVDRPGWNETDIVILFDGTSSRAAESYNGTASGAPELFITYDTSTGGTGCSSTSNLALAGTASQSSTGNGGVASRAIDDNTNGKFNAGSVTHTATGQSQSYFDLDLTDVFLIEDLILWERTDACCQNRLNDYYVFISETPFTSTDPIVTAGQAGVWSQFRVDDPVGSETFNVDQNGRYVRVQLAGTNILNIAELQVFGCNLEICGNGIDDDGDGTTDCADTDCDCCTLDPGVITEASVTCPSNDPATLSSLVSPSQCNLVINPQAEDGTSEWTSFSGTGASAVFAIDGTSQLSGVNSFSINQTSASGTFWNTETFSNEFEIYDGLNYTFSFEASAPTTRDIQISLQIRKSPWTEWGYQVITLTPTPTTYTYTITPGIDETNVTAIFKTGNEIGEVFIDNVSVVPSSCTEPSFDYEWEYSDDGGVTWTIVSGATSESYDPAAITADITYRRNARVSGCSTWETSNEVLAETCPCSVIAPADETICEGESVTLTTIAEGTVTYAWSPTNGLNDPTAANPIASPSSTTTYTVTVDDGAGCTDTDQVVVNVDAIPVVTTASTDASCDLDNGTITFTFTNHPVRTNVAFSIDGGATYPYLIPDNSGSFILDNLSPATYDLWTRWGDQDCPVDLADETIVQLGSSVADAGVDQVICLGECIDLTASGAGTGGSYDWDNSLGSGATHNVCPSVTTTYTVTITDANGCEDTDEVLVTVRDNPSATTASTDASCDLDNGTITFTFPNNPVFTNIEFSIDGGATFPHNTPDNVGSLTLSDLPEGMYDLWVRWGNNKCPVDLTDVTITQLGAPTVDAGIDAAICLGECIDLTATGGNNGDIYTWDQGLGAGATHNVCPTITTMYTVTITDVNSCEHTDEVVITVRDLPSATTASTDANCDLDNGTITFTFPNHPTFTNIEFSIDGGVTYPHMTPDNVGSLTVSDLPVGMYDLWIRWGNNSCPIDLGEETIVQQGNPVVTLDLPLTDQCADATINVLSGGVPVSGVYSGPGVIGDNFDASAAGLGTHEITYTYTEANGCVATATDDILVRELPEVTLTLDIDQACEDVSTIVLGGGLPATGTYSGDHVSGGVFDVDAAGVGAHTVTYTYTDANGCTSSATDDITIAEVITPTLNLSDVDFCIDETTYTLNEGVPAFGIYIGQGVVGTNFDASAAGLGPHTITYMYITPAGCSAQVTAIVTVHDLPTATFAPSVTSVCVSDAPFDLDGFSPEGGTFSGPGISGIQLDPSALPDPINTITYTYTDVNGCIATASADIERLVAPEVTTTNSTQPSCELDNGSITLEFNDVDNTDNIQFSLDGGLTWEALVADDSGSVTYSDLAPGNYDLRVRNESLSCTVDLSNVTLTNQASPTVDVGLDFDYCIGETVDVSPVVSDGTAPFDYQWTGPGGFNETTIDITVVEPGTYDLLVTDDNNCTTTGQFIATRNDSTEIFCEQYRLRDSSGNLLPWNVLTDCVVEMCAVDGGYDLLFDAGPDINTGWVWTDEDGNTIAEQSETGVFDDLGVDDSGIYTAVYTNPEGCASTLNFELIVYANPIADAGEDLIICGGQSAELTASGGDSYLWNDPAGSTTATITVFPSVTTTYTVTVSNANGCESTDEVLVTVNEQATVTLAEPEVNFCMGEAAITLTGGSPAGGTYSGPGVSGGVFDPSAAGIGNHLITYTVDNGCVATATQTLNVFASPTVTFNPTQDFACEDEFGFTLDGESPQGGTFSGPGVSGNYFDITVAGAGMHTVRYTYIDQASGCEDSADAVIDIRELPEPELILGIDEACNYETDIVLSGGSPAGGTYSGNGVSGGVFDATMVGSGDHQITYTVTVDGCTGTVVDTITVLQSTFVGLNLFNDQACINSATFTLEGGQPINGTYSGLGVTGTNFDATVAGLGTHVITYTFIDDNGCSNTATDEIQVNDLSSVTLVLTQAVACADILGFTLDGGMPLGGTYSGVGVSGNYFDVSLTGPGTYEVTYTHTDPVTGCANTATQDVTILESPTVTLDLADDSECVENNTLALGGGFPSGGTWSGPGVTGSNFDAAVAGIGDHAITYTYVDAEGCENSAQDIMTVTDIPNVWFSLSDYNACEDETAHPLDGGMPANGVWSGPGVIGSIFDATQVAPGPTQITYTFTDENGCTNSQTQDMFVDALPIVTLNIPQPNLCFGEDNITFTGESPSGGVWSGPGISGSVFNTTTVGLGTYTITYTYTDPGTGCTDFTTQDVTVVDVPTVTLELTSTEACTEENIQVLEGGIPAGGTWSGPHVSGNNFDPSAAGEGTHTIRYTFTDANGCTNFAEDDITVFDPPVPQLTLGDNAVCEDEIITLSGGTPVGGTWSGIGVTGDQFDATVAGPGTHTITYSFAISTCVNEVTQDIIVHTLPVVSFALPQSDICFGDLMTLEGGLPSGGTYSGPGVSGTTFDATLANVGTHTITYTYTDGNGCANTATQDIIVKALHEVTFVLDDEFACVDETTHALTTVSPSGGVWTGTGVTGNNFNPSVAGVGSHAITYTSIENDCPVSVTQLITVLNLPDVALNLRFDEGCLDHNAESLQGGTPLGGVYTGPGVVGNTIDPAIAGVGQHTITYTFTTDEGCVDFATDIYEVYPLPTVDFVLPDDEMCIGETITLSGGTPTGGTYTGRGVNQFTGIFNSAVAGFGTHDITYTFTDAEGCENTAVAEITVHNVTPAGFDLPVDRFCVDEVITLSGEFPTGGQWSGPGVSGNTFDASVAGGGEHPITYTFTNEFGCETTDTDRVIVDLEPEVSFTFEDDHCGQNIGSVTFDFGDVIGVQFIEFSLNGGTTWLGNVDDDDVSITYNNLSAGSYDLMVRNAVGTCEIDLGSITLLDLDPPTADAGIDQTINLPNTAQLSASGGVEYRWTPSSSLNDRNIAFPIASPDVTTTYTVEVTDQWGCKATDEVTVTVIPPCVDVLGDGDYPYIESFEGGLGAWAQELVEDDFDWDRVNGGNPSSGSDGSWYITTDCNTGCASQSGAQSVTASSNVTNSNRATGLSDDLFAQLYQDNSLLTLDMGSTLAAGTIVSIRWRRKSTYSPGPFADMIVEESANNSSWNENSVRPSTAAQAFVVTSLTLESNTRYLRFRPETGSNDDFDLDAVFSSSGGTDQVGIIKSPCFDLDDQSCAQLTFDYHLRGSSSGTLTLQTSTDFGLTWFDSYVIPADGSGVWTTQIVDLFPFLDETLQLRFVADMGGGAIGFALDNMEFITTGCGCDDTSNPFDGFTLDGDPAPFAVDFDGDGDSDMVVGTDGFLFYWVNNGDGTYYDATGTAEDPLPDLDWPDMTVGFVDLDADGDLDLSVVSNDADVANDDAFYWNTGTSTNAIFTLAGTGGTPADPIAVVDFQPFVGHGGADPTLFWVDLDNDRDFDAVIGGKQGWFHYYENIGDPQSPNLVQRTGADNPFDGLRADGMAEANGITQWESSPYLVDWDGDGDLDLFTGNQIATIQYFENIGTRENPVFVEVIGDLNPFNNVIFSEDTHITIFDEDCDGDWDIFYGVGDNPNDAEVTECDLLVALPDYNESSSSQDHYCLGDPAFLFETSPVGISWSWTGPNGFSSTEQNPVIPSLTEAGAGTYTVVMTNAQGCEFTSEVELTVSFALADAGEDQTIELGTSTQLFGQGTNGVEFEWTPSTGLSNTSILNPVAAPTETTTYTLTVTDEFGCTATDEVTIFVESEDCVFLSEFFAADFETGTGDNFWTLDNGAGDGNFLLGVPDPYSISATVLELPALEGNRTLLTGNSPGDLNDLDNGTSVATSRDIVIPADATDVTVNLSWYFAHLANSDTDDFFRIEIRDAGNNSVLETLVNETGADSKRNAEWSNDLLTSDLSAHVGKTIYVRVYARDGGDGSQVEAAVDLITMSGKFTTTAQFTLAEVDFCNTDAVITLPAGTPAGGTYTGAGVTGNEFDPVAAGPGMHQISYEFTNEEGCLATASVDVEVYETPETTLDLTADEVCVIDDPVVLFGGQPLGGTYTGNGVVGSEFDPATAGVGTHKIYYTVITDEGCTAVDSAEFVVVSTPDVTMVSHTDATCDQDNGTITFEFNDSNSLTHIQFSLDGGVTWLAQVPDTDGSVTYDNLPAGDYDLWVRRGNQKCPLDLEDVTIENASGPLVEVGEDISLCNGATEEVTPIVEQGTEPYTYAWTGPNGFTSEALDIIVGTAGVYTLIVTDANNCTATDALEVSTFDIDISVAVDDLSCFGDDNGRLTATPSDATTHTFELTGQSSNTTGVFNNLSEGYYELTVTNAQGCTFVQGYSVAGPTLLECSQDSCVRSITSMWSGGLSGPWTATAGSTGIDLSVVHGVNTRIDNIDLGQTLTASNPAWFVEGAAGLPAMRFQYAWDDDAETEFTDLENPSDDKGTAIFTLNFDEPVKDVVLHIDRLGGAGGFVGNFISNSSEWTLTTAGVEMQKLSGTIDLLVEADKFYKTPDVPSSLEPEAGDDFMSTAAGSIAFTSADPITSLTFEVTGIGIEGAGFDAVEMAWSTTVCYPDLTSNFGCENMEGAATVSACGGVYPYSYEWDNGEMTQTATALSGGDHTVTITDANGCDVICSVTIAEDTLEVEAGGNISFCEGESGMLTPTITATSTPYQVTWSGPDGFASTDEVITVTDNGTYIITIIDNNGCSVSDQVEVYTFICDAETPCHFLHEFSTFSYWGSDGTLSWSSTSWDETGDNSSAASGVVGLTGTELYMSNNGNNPSIKRVVDLSGHSSAILSFDFRTTGSLDANDIILVEVFDGTTWNTVFTFSGAAIGSQSPALDISAFIASNTEIRFTVSSGYEDSGEEIFIDNVRIDADCLCAGIADAGPDASFCADGQIQLNGSGGVSYVWSPAAGLSDPNSPNPTATITEETTYTLTVTDADGCMDTDEVVISLLPELVAVASVDDEIICPGETAQLDVEVKLGYTPANFTYINSYNPNASLIGPEGLFDGIDNVSGQSFHAQRDVAGQEWGIGYDLGGPQLINNVGLERRNDCCTNRAHGGVVQIYNNGILVYESNPVTGTGNDEVRATPAPNVTGDEVRYVFLNGVDTEDGNTLNFSEWNIYVEGATYAWDPSATLSDGTIHNPVASPDGTTTYTVTVTDANGCPAVAEVTVNVHDEIEADANALAHDHCLDGSGMATVSVTAGMGPFTISWQNTEGGEEGTTTINSLGDYTIPDLNGGTTYCIEVLDMNGCKLQTP